MSKTAILSGGGGSIGIHVISYFLEKTDWSIVSIDSFHHKGYRDRLKRVLQDHPEWKDRVREVQHDLTCPISPEMIKNIGAVDYILHLAALSDVFFSIENPVYTVQNNINSTLTMLEYARSVKPSLFLYFSTDETLGPVKKGDAHPENHPHRPSNAYASAKAASEDICYAYWRSYGIPLVITRTMNNFGEFQSSSKFPVIIQKKVESGETVTIHGNDKEIGTRFYIHSRSSADALLYIIQNLPPHLHEQGQLDEPSRYHVVGERAVSNLELAQTIAGLMGKELKYEIVDFHRDNPAHDIDYGLQDNKLRKHGWRAPLNLEDGLAQTISWQQENKEWIE